MSLYLLTALLTLILAQLVYILFAHLRSRKRDELFRIITENAADMIALVDTKGRRLYNSPAYHRILGYSPAELAETPVFEQIHPDDRFKVLEAGREARSTGVGKSLQYRLRHKDGSWRTLESTASAICNREGEVEKLVIVNRDVTERVHAEQQLAHHTLHDPLTGLPNRRLFLDRLSRCHAHAQREPNFRYAVLLADLDAFKSVNHSLGSDAGDQVLLEVARRLEAALRSTDSISPSDAGPTAPNSSDAFVLSRMSSDNFAILVETCATPSDALRVAHRLQAAVSAPIIVPQGEARCSLSIGTALSAQPPVAAEALLREAESALRRARALGPGHCELSDHAQHNQAVGRLQLEVDLRSALNQNQFRVFYQPVFRIPERELVGFEALLRWQHPQQGLISPSEFLHVAEDTGLMAMIDLWVIREAARTLAALPPSSSRSLHLAVNLSAHHFASPCLCDGLRGALAEASRPLSFLQIGIPERLAMANPALTTAVLSQLRHAGFHTALDNFGSSTISLHALQTFPLDLLKIDRALILNMQADRATTNLVDLIAAIAQKLPCDLLAQGVETITQLDHLRTRGCRFAQGYLFSPPLDAGAIEPFLRRHPNTPTHSSLSTPRTDPCHPEQSEA
jgi:PAS domain S-box-containing protein